MVAIAWSAPTLPWFCVVHSPFFQNSELRSLPRSLAAGGGGGTDIVAQIRNPEDVPGLSS
jgi:hypothetical protein